MRILLIADASSIWTAKYIEEVLLPSGLEVVLATPGRSTQAHEEGAYGEIYRDPSVRVITAPVLPWFFSKIPGLRGGLSRSLWKKSLRPLGPFDVTHVQQVVGYRLALAVATLTFSRKLVLSYWGSDLLRVHPDVLARNRRHVERAQVVTVGSVHMLERLRAAYPFSRDVRLIPFGVNGLEAIDAVSAREDLGTSRESLGIPEGQPVLVLGYNGRVEQQHLEMIDAVAQLPLEVQRSVRVVLPMSYGASPEYLMRVRKALMRLESPTTVIDRFLSPTDQARLCLSADVLVHGQTTDAMAASVQEFLYAGVRLINGGWLDYPELDALGVQYQKFGSWDDLSAMIASSLNDGVLKSRELKRVNAIALRSRSWRAVSDAWRAVYVGESK